MSKPNIKIKGNIQDLKKKEKNEKPKQTNYLLTINLNQSYKEDDEHLKNDIEVFDHSIQSVLNNIQDYLNLPDPSDWSDDKIKDAKIDYTIERGNKKGHLHIHILLKFQHFTKIQLNYQKIKEKLCQELGLKNIYMYNRLLKPSSDVNIMEYINKYI
jgi:light-regulated signal transduction histidine kinase (bacteriophytochrome)